MQTMGMTLIKHAAVVTPFAIIENGFITVKDGNIFFIGDAGKDSREFAFYAEQADEVLDFQGRYALPGFIDIHTHGVLGKDYGDTPELVVEDPAFRASTGVTGYLPTLGAFVTPEKLLESAGRLTQLMKEARPGAVPLGINMEGPFLRPDLGAQDAENCFWSIDIEYLKRAKKIMGDQFRIITIAPELENSLDAITWLRNEGIIPSIGHTKASEAELDAAIRHGANLVTHLLNTTYQPEQTLKGIMLTGANEYLMIRDDVMGEAIVDVQGIHINPTMLKVLVRCKGVDKIVMITDSFITPGTEKGKMYRMPNGLDVYEENGVNVQAVRKHVCGSAMTMDLSFKSMMNHTGLGMVDVSKMTSLNPARILGIDHEKGSLEIGKDADIITADSDLNIHAAMVNGKVVYSRKN